MYYTVSFVRKRERNGFHSTLHFCSGCCWATPAKTATNQYGTPCTSPRAWLSVTLASELCIGFVLHATTELTTYFYGV